MKHLIKVTGVMLALATLSANATIISINSIAANWTALSTLPAEIPPDLNFQNLDSLPGNEIVLWGKPIDGFQSTLAWEGAAQPGFDVTSDSDFVLGELTQRNVPTFNLVLLAEFELELKIEFAIDGQSALRSFFFDLEYTTTPNTSISDDFAKIKPADSRNRFDFNNDSYFLQVSGFGQNGALSNIFSVPESETDRANLVVSFEQLTGAVIPVSVPEPGSLALLAAGIVGIGLTRRSRKKYRS